MYTYAEAVCEVYGKIELFTDVATHSMYLYRLVGFEGCRQVEQIIIVSSLTEIEGPHEK